MKKVFLSLFVAMMAMVAVKAQQIAVVSKTGSTSVYQTLTKAIEGASDGSVIYLPGGGFQIHDSVKISKQLSIIGIGHKAHNENADGNTVISGNLFFNEGSSNSAVMGCYISGNVNIGGAVNNVLIKYCNLNAVSVSNELSSGTMINQNYIRNSSVFNFASVTITNNILHSVGKISGGVISNNIITSYRYENVGTDAPLREVSNATVTNNIFFRVGTIHTGSNLTTYGNMASSPWGDECYNMSGIAWTDIFVNYNNGNITPVSDFHFKEDYQQYSDVGIYGGTGFSDGALPPVPFIVSKSIPEQTDASGKLNIKIRVKAGE